MSCVPSNEMLSRDTMVSDLLHRQRLPKPDFTFWTFNELAVAFQVRMYVFHSFHRYSLYSVQFIYIYILFDLF